MIRKLSARQWGGLTEYPTLSISAALLLLLLSPFVTGYLCYVVLLICIYRMVRYDVRVFATDYCLMIPMSQLFRTSGGMSLLIWLCMVAAIWYAVRGKLRVGSAFVWLIILFNYLLVRMKTNINGFALCFGQMFLLLVLLPNQTSESAERTIKAFCWSLLISSTYALLFRNTSQIMAIRGPESSAYNGSTIKRFMGIFEDPNYYMTLLLTGIAVLVKLRECKKITVGYWLSMSACFAFLGILTFSKAFLLVFVLLVIIYIVWQFRNRKWITATLLTLGVLAAAGCVFAMEGSLISVVLYRLLSANTLSELTTGRSDIIVEYWAVITENLWNLIFGLGLDAPMLSKETHNIYLEAIYTTGCVGMILMIAYYWSIAQLAGRRTKSRGELFSKYFVLLIVLAVYFSLHGMTAMVFYTSMFLAFAAMKLDKTKEVDCL